MAEEPKTKSWLAKGIWEEVKGFFVSMFESTWSGFIETVPASLDFALKWWKEKVQKRETERWSFVLDQYIKSGLISADIKKPLMELRKATPPFDTIFLVAIRLQLTLKSLTQQMGPLDAFANRAINADSRPELPRPEQVLNAAFIAPEKTGTVRKVLAETGFSEEHIDLLFSALYKTYDPEYVRVLFLRGVLSKELMFVRMRELGYTDTRIEEMVQAWQVIPGPGDLVTMVAKEAFEPDIIKEVGLDAEFPGAQLQWFEKQGLSEEWVRRYWYAHWEQPSIQQGYEMLHRGVIDTKQLDLLFRIVEIPPYWREKLLKIAYHPYTRVDVRRMHKIGVLNDEQLIRNYLDLGFDSDKAKGMAEFTKKYNQQTAKGISKSEVLKGYREKLIEEKEAIAMLLQLGYPLDETTYLLRFQDYQELKEIQDDEITEIRLRYEENLLNEAEARRQLDNLNLQSRQTDALIRKWRIQRFADRKIPSKADLGKFLRAQIITREKYKEELARLGYSQQYIAWYMELDLKAA